MTTLTTDPTLDTAWELSSAVALRPEPFGALAYHFGNRKLTFLKTQELVDVLHALGGCATIADALAQIGIARTRWAAYLAALRGLAAADMIHERTP